MLEIFLKNYFKFFDNNFIIKLLKYYKSKTPIANSELYPLINSDTYKIPLEFIKNFGWLYDSSYYLFNACESGNEAGSR